MAKASTDDGSSGFPSIPHMTQPVRRQWHVHCCVFILGEGSRYYRDRHQSSLMTVTTGLWSG